MREGDSATDDVTRVLDPGAAAYPRVFADPDPAGSLGRYAIIEELGRGGMGVVLRAYDPNLQREVALKIVRTSALSADAEGRLVREARAMARLSHPNVVAIFDVVVEEMTDGAAQSRVVLAMEYVAGSTLRRWLLAEDRTADEVLDRFVRAGRGLAAAHREGLLHRDFKPDNVLVGDDGRVRVTDFGLARFEVGSESGGAASGPQRVADPAADPEHAVEADRSGPLSDASNLLSSSGTPLTRAGTVMGTPRYMAPEQHRDESLTAAIDQYAFCIALWEALLVESPFSGEGKALARAKAQGPPPWPDKGVVSAGIAAAIRRGLSPDPARRFDDMEALLAELSTPKSQTVRRWAPLLLTGAVTGALSWAAFARDPDAPQCTGAGPAMAEVWNADRRASVRSAILATEVAFAPGVHERIGRQLDAWATRWRAAHTETCEATRVRGEQSEAVMDRRMACLQRARSELDAAVRVLTEATSSTVGRAHRVVDGLPRLSRCADVERLLADVAPPSPGQAAAVAVIRADLARSAAQERAGAYAQAQESALRAEAKTASLDYPPIRTEVWLQLANVHDAMGRFADAERALREAQRLGARWQQWELVGDATRQLMWILGYQQARYSEALALREVAEGLSSTPRAEAAFRNNLATILNAQGKYVEAEAELRAALALKVQVVGAAHVGTASTRNNLAVVLKKQERYAEAEAEQRTALALWSGALGPEHPDVAQSRSNLGNMLDDQGKYAEAEAEHRAALAIRIAALGAAHTHVATSRDNLGVTLHSLGRDDEAEQEYRAALAVRVAALGPQHPDVAFSRNNLAVLLRARGQLRAAQAEYRASLEILTDALGPEHPMVAQSRNNLGNVLVDLGRHGEAEAEYRAALSVRLAVLPEGHADIVRSQLILGDHLVAQRRGGEALPFLERARRAVQGSSASVQLQADSAFSLARALSSSPGARARAGTLLDEAIAGYTRAGGSAAADLARARAWSLDPP